MFAGFMLSFCKNEKPNIQAHPEGTGRPLGAPKNCLQAARPQTVCSLGHVPCPGICAWAAVGTALESMGTI